MNKTDTKTDIYNDFIYENLVHVSKEFILPLYGRLKKDQISIKSRLDDFVTEADKNSEKFLKPKLLNLIKGSNFIGEESYNKLKNYDNPLSEYTWTCDPIDGTYNYVNNLDKFCVMISLCKLKIPIASWLYFPVFDIFCYSHLNSSVIFKDDKNEIKVSRKNNKIQFETINGFNFIIDNLFKNFCPQKDKNNFLVAKNLRCAGFEIIALVCGKIDYLHHKYLTPWDHSPVFNLAKSSGCGILLNPKEKNFNYNYKGQLLCTSSNIIYDKLK